MTTFMNGLFRTGGPMSRFSATSLKIVGIGCFLLLWASSMNAQVVIEPNPMLAPISGGAAAIAYPNPAESHITVTTQDGVEIVGIKVLDTYGNIVFQGDYSVGVLWNAEAMVSGVYTLLVITSQGTVSIPISVV